MREQQFIRFVEQICFLLKLSQPCSKTALQYFLQFKEYQNHHYDQQILVAACIYLSVKIFQEEVRIRDILNMIYVLTSLYKLSTEQTISTNQSKKNVQDMSNPINTQEKEIQIQQPQSQSHPKSFIPQNNLHEENSKPKPQIIEQAQQQNSHYQEQPYILLKNIQKLQNLAQLIQPQYSLSDYNEYKGKIIQAEQMLLRILGFSFSLSEQNKKQLKRLLITIHLMRIPPTIAQTIIKLYNDIHYIDIKYWPEGVIYFGYLVSKVFVKQKMQNSSVQNLSLKESLSQASQGKANDKQAVQISRMSEFISLMSEPRKWQDILSADFKQLENYAQKLTRFYSGIKVNQ